MKQVLITDPIHDEGIKLLEAGGYEVVIGYEYTNDDIRFQVKCADALIVRTETTVDRLMIQHGSKSLKVIGRAGVGLDNIDLEAAEEYEIPVFNTPDANVISAAEHTVGMMIALARHIPQATGGTRQGRWERHRFLGVELNGKTLAIIGCGRVGVRVARICNAIGMYVRGYDPFQYNSPDIHYVDSPIELVKTADFISIHTPLNENTRGYIGDYLLSYMKRGVRIINCARGPLVDQAALIEALDVGIVAGYACDVFEEEPMRDKLHPFYSRRNIICTPHIGAMTEDAQMRVSLEICGKIRGVLDASEDGSSS